MLTFLQTKLMEWPLYLAADSAAADSPQNQQSPWTMLPPLVIMFGILYLLILRPQQKRQKEHRQMLTKLGKGDKVLTSGGIVGIVANVKDTVVVVRIAENVKVEVNKGHIAEVISSSGKENG